MTQQRSPFQAILPWAIFALVLVALPFIFQSRTSLTIMNAIGVNIVFALSYNMLLGQGGMLSFGHAVYYGLGGYAAIHLMVAIKGGLGIPVHLTPLVGFAGGMLAGAIFGYPSCRRSGTPFAMISLGIGEMMAAAAFMFTGWFGGEEGLSANRNVGPSLFGYSLGPINHTTAFILFWMFLAMLAMWAFTRTPLGRLSNAVRDNPDRVPFIGYDPSKLRYLIFMFAGGFAGVAGAMSAVSTEIMTPDTLGAAYSGPVLLMAFIGGIGVFYGPIIGAVAITLMHSLLSDYTSGWQLYVGILFMAMVMFAPQGFGGMIERVRRAVMTGEVGALAKDWLLGFAALLVAMLGAVIIIELVLRLRESGHSFKFFGMAMAANNPLSWAAGLILLGAGFGALHVMKLAKAKADIAQAQTSARSAA